MPTIEATPGHASANSYLSLAEFNTYLAERLHNKPALTAATDDLKQRALIQGTRYLNAGLDWTGERTTTTQALDWPRTGMAYENGVAVPDNIIPIELKNTDAEVAAQMIESNRTGDSDIEKYGVTDMKVGPLSFSFSKDAVGRSSGLPPVLPDVVTFLLPDSWYTLPSETNFLFEAI
jgi:hypothetical protein